jgi:hypothetical protein
MGRAPHPAPKALYFTVRNLDAVHERATALGCLSADVIHDALDSAIAALGHHSTRGFGGHCIRDPHDTLIRLSGTTPSLPTCSGTENSNAERDNSGTEAKDILVRHRQPKRRDARMVGQVSDSKAGTMLWAMVQVTQGQMQPSKSTSAGCGLNVPEAYPALISAA